MTTAEVELPENVKEELNKYLQFSQYKYTWIAGMFLTCPLDVLALFFGNQAGKGALVIINYILRIMGHHPVARKNILYYECKNKHYYSPADIVYMKFGTDPFAELYSKKYVCPKCKEPLTPHIREGSHRIIRFASQNMPGSETVTRGKGKREENTGIGETKNTQYIELMKWLPPHLLRDKKISIRDATQRIVDPFPTGMDIIIEYMSFNQMTQSGAGHQRLSAWLDELAGKDFFDEQLPRILAVAGADIILSYTVTKEVGYLFDLIWNRARKIYRSQSIVDFFRKSRNEILPQEEETDSDFKNIAIFQASTYDNPTLDHDRIDEIMMLLHDDCCDNVDMMNMRKYCIFSEISSVIFPTFNNRVHVIDPDRWFKDGHVCLN
ncbi:hypothetical protein LCGC14_0771870 [marine sediment metagenome]|uniref:Uncharacterized protein n=1 Tax=marine sediment metagenome TaxID=412755 RepID=A0A0F9PY71_9ZZZZ|nr:hypothetical protein [Candidatus Scalindua sp.]